MIKSRSPYIVTTNFIDPLNEVIALSYTLNIYVWDGDKNSPPSEPTYTITKENITLSASDDRVNISRIVNSLISITPIKGSVTSLLSSNNHRWLKHAVVYSTSDVEQYENTTLLTNGYGYGNEGENAQPPSNRVYLTGDEYNVNRSGYVCFPIEIH